GERSPVGLSFAKVFRRRRILRILQDSAQLLEQSSNLRRVSRRRRSAPAEDRRLADHLHCEMARAPAGGASCDEECDFFGATRMAVHGGKTQELLDLRQS